MTSVAVRKRAPPKGGGLGLLLAMIPQEQASAPSAPQNRLCKQLTRKTAMTPRHGRRNGQGRATPSRRSGPPCPSMPPSPG